MCKRHVRIIIVTMLAALLTGCGSAAPTATPVPPTHTPAPPPTQVPPTATPMPPTDTPTATSVPPTHTPAPTPTATQLPPLGGSGGGVIAFFSDRDGNEEIYIMNVDGSDPQRLTDNPAYDAWPVWSPDGSQIAFTSTRNGKADIYVMNADGSNLRQLTQHSAGDIWPEWSPDGTRIAFPSRRDGNFEIYVINADGTNLQRLTNTPDAEDFPAWSPDSSQIVFSSIEGNEGTYIMNADGGDRRQLTDIVALEPAWSPDGTRIAFASDHEGFRGIYVMDADGSNLQRLSQTRAGENCPDWSPDGTRIAFASWRDGDGEIYVMDADGSNLQKLTDNRFEEEFPAWRPSPADTSTSPLSAYWPTEGWRTSTPEQQWMDSERLAEGLDFLQERREEYNVHSLLIVHNGYVVADAYFYPFTQDTKHDLASVTKSFIATLIGIAIDEGYINSVRQPVLDFFPERTVANVDANKRAMTVEDLLTMRSGLDCIVRSTEVTLFEMVRSPDWVQFTLDLPMSEEPGARFVYCSSGVHLLSAIIQQASGMSALDFAQKHLFDPLGISDVAWPSVQGINFGWGDLRITPHAMAKLGYLYLHEGLWEGQQVLSPEWVAAATSVPEGASFGGNYGYLWWLSSGFYSARGRGGQMIYVVPDQDMVVVFTGGGGGREDEVTQELLTSYIIPAAESETILPASPDGAALLASKIQQAAAPAQAEPEPVMPLPEMAQRVSGQTYLLEGSSFGMRWFSLTFQEQQDEALFKWIFYGTGDQGIEYRVGLDGVPRISEGRFGIPAAVKGSWESDNVFVIHLDEVGNTNKWRIRLNFDGERVSVQMQEVATGLASETFGGQLER